MARYLFLIAVAVLGCSRTPDFQTFQKRDSHVHLETYDESFVEVIRQNHMGLITLVTRSNPRP